MLDALEDAAVLLSFDGRVEFWNRAAEVLYGVARSEAKGRSLQDVIVVAPGNVSWSEIRTRVVGSGRLKDRSVHLAADGRPIPVEVCMEFVHSPEAPGSEYLLTCRDVSESSRTEQALRELQDLYRMVMQQTLMSVVLIDENGLVMEFNPASEELTGLRREQAVGRPYTDVLESMVPDGLRSPEASERRRARIAKALCTGVPSTEGAWDSQYRLRNGSTGWVEQMVYPIPTAKGYRFGAIAHDVTERKRLAIRLQQSAKMEALGQLAGGIAHDFNNLLTAISGNLSLVLSDLPRESPVHPMITDAAQAADSAAALTRRLLAFSRRQHIEARMLDVNELIRASERMLTRLIGETLRLTTSLAPDLGATKLDPSQFDQLLVNLVVNARDAMPSGGNLTIETENVALDVEFCRNHPDARPGPYVLMAVNDTGHGIRPEIREHLFEPFFTTKPVGKGTGLGLAMVHSVVTQAEGALDVLSEPGRGTSFRVYFPAVAQPAVPLRAAAPDEKLLGGGETILFVDDEALVCETGARILEWLGYKVLRASDGEEALRVAREFDGRIDLLLSDMVMPGATGRELADQVLKERPGVKVLLSTGYSRDLSGTQRLPEGEQHVIAKPYTVADLASTVRAVLDGG